MTSVENRNTRGAGRLGLRAFASALALSALVHPSLLAAQETRPTAQSSQGMSASGTQPLGIGPEGIATRASEMSTSAPAVATDPTTTATIAPNSFAMEPLADPDAVPLDDDIGRQNLRET
ncbi:MAG: hypothetical protein ACK40W_06240, partial [Allorhizobium sp.]